MSDAWWHLSLVTEKHADYTALGEASGNFWGRKPTLEPKQKRTESPFAQRYPRTHRSNEHLSLVLTVATQNLEDYRNGQNIVRFCLQLGTQS